MFGNALQRVERVSWTSIDNTAAYKTKLTSLLASLTAKIQHSEAHCRKQDEIDQLAGKNTRKESRTVCRRFICTAI